MILVIGYGNTLRRDDGIGPWIAEEIASRRIPGVEVMTPIQLTVELAEPISRADAVVFIDARMGQLEPVVVTPLTATANGESWTHLVSPASLLALASLVYGRIPPAHLVSVAGDDFGVGEELSSAAEEHCREALARVLQMTSAVDALR